MGAEFGDAYGQILSDDLVIAELGDISASEAIRRGMPPRAVWEALCRAAEVPESRWHGVGLPAPKNTDS